MKRKRRHSILASVSRIKSFRSLQSGTNNEKKEELSTLLIPETCSSREGSIRIDLERCVWISIYILYDLRIRPTEILRVPIASSFLYGGSKGRCLLLICDWSKFLIDRVHDFIENRWTRPCREWNSQAQPECSLEIVTLNSRSRVSPTNDRGEPPQRCS